MADDDSPKETPRNPLCFVLMPFGIKTDALGRPTDFDAVYRSIIAPAIQMAGLDPLRADEERIGGSIHKPMFERLMMCPYAVADITGANPNVYYELGIRHALRPRATVVLFSQGTVLPFDVAMLRGIPYRTDEKGEPVDPRTHVEAVAKILRAARDNPHDDSPMFQLIENMPRIEVDHSKTDLFRESVAYSEKYKQRLDVARKSGAEAVAAVAADPALANLLEVEVGVIIDLYLSQRAVKAHAAMIELYQRMPAPLQRSKMMREQLGFALNREGRHEEAEKVLKDVIAEFGPSSETNGLLGRVYKDRWEIAKKDKRPEARNFLRRAIESYLTGFQADWRDAYPGINAVTLMEMQDKPDPMQGEILPVVKYAASQKAKRSADYWDYATLLELAVIGRDLDDAENQLGDVLAMVTEPWQLDTTERNLRLIRELRTGRGEDAAWVAGLEQALGAKRVEMETQQKSA
jgi:tetratricopeptide (TPR) repeat protein